MKEYPIMFTGEMVYAIFNERKTQTRRCGNRWGKVQPGDRLWVKETWCWCWKCARSNNPDWYHAHDEDNPSVPLDICGVKYAVDSNGAFETCHPINPKTRAEEFKWQPSIFMPRWASRITLEVVSKGNQHVRAISEEDAMAEGVDPGCGNCGYDNLPYGCGCEKPEPLPIDAFIRLWDSISGKKPGRSWADNPAVWVIEFKMVKP